MVSRTVRHYRHWPRSWEWLAKIAAAILLSSLSSFTGTCRALKAARAWIHFFTSLEINIRPRCKHHLSFSHSEPQEESKEHSLFSARCSKECLQLLDRVSTHDLFGRFRDEGFLHPVAMSIAPKEARKDVQ